MAIELSFRSNTSICSFSAQRGFCLCPFTFKTGAVKTGTFSVRVVPINAFEEKSSARLFGTNLFDYCGFTAKQSLDAQKHHGGLKAR